MSIDTQPISNVVWRPVETLHANDYNPNHVAPPEMALLAVSIIEDGWTTAIVVRPHDTIPDEWEVVDGFHRWTLASNDPRIFGMTDGMVPTVTIDPDFAHRRLSTIRHNRARGTHHVVKMADIVATLTEVGVTEDDLVTRCGMDREEARRLLARGNMIERGAAPDGFTEAWRPAPKR